MVVLYWKQYRVCRAVKGLYLNTPPNPKQAYRKMEPRGHTKKSWKLSEQEDLEQGLEVELERELT